MLILTLATSVTFSTENSTDLRGRVIGESEGLRSSEGRMEVVPGKAKGELRDRELVSVAFGLFRVALIGLQL